MRRFLPAMLLIATASPALAVSEPPRLPEERVAMADRLYPELDVQGDGWRGLLPIMLMNSDQGIQPRSAGTDGRPGFPR